MKAGILVLSVLPHLTAVSARPHRKYMHRTNNASLGPLTVIAPLQHGHNVKPALLPTTVTVSGAEVVAYVNHAGSTVGIETAIPTSTDAFTSPPFIEETAVSALPVPGVTALPVDELVTTFPAPGRSVTVQPVEDTATVQPVETRSLGNLLSIPNPPQPKKRSASGEAAKLPPFIFPGGKRTAGTEVTKRRDTTYGICYAPYTDQGECKDDKQVDHDFSQFNGYGIVRSYGTDCDQIPKMVNAAKAHDKKIFIGIFDIKNLDGELQAIIDAVDGDWDLVAALSVGNEQVNSGQSSAQEVIQALNRARDVLRTREGYTGPIVTVDTTNAFLDHPELCQASDFCGVNSNAFFDANTAAADAGAFVHSQARMVTAAAGGKRVVITESGWPHRGSRNGKAIASASEQRAALESLKKEFEGTNGNLFLFSAFDDPWKEDDEYTFGAEKFWGFAAQ